MNKHSHFYFFIITGLATVFFFSQYQFAKGETGKPILSVSSNESELYVYNTACTSNALRKTQAFIIPKGVAAVESLYVYFHGTGDPTAENICTNSNFELCSETANMAKKGVNAAVILNLGYKKDTDANDLNLTQLEMQCFLTEAKEKIGAITKVNTDKFSVAGHSKGGNSVLKYLQNGFAAEKIIIFDGCWNDKCTKIANLSAGNVFLYTTKFDGNDVQAQAAAEAAPNKVTLLEMKSGSTAFAEHLKIPGQCFADHIVNDLCHNKAETTKVSEVIGYGIGKSCQSDSDCSNNLDCEDSDLDQDNDDFCVCREDYDCEKAYGTAGAKENWECKNDGGIDAAHALHYCVGKDGPKYPISSTAATSPTDASVLSDISHALKNTPLSEEELKSLLQKPKVKIKIPGLSFSDIDIQGQLSGDDLGNTYLNIPFLGEYIASLYKYLVVIAGIFCVVRIIIGGFLFTVPDTSGTSKSTGKTMITQAISGLLISVASYTILYTINPNLVEFQNLKVLYARGIEFPFEDVVVDNESTGYGQGAPVGTISVDAAKTIGGLIQPSTFTACSKEAAQDISKKLASLKICVGPCHCAFTASRFLSFIGCGNPLHGSANRLAIQLEQMGWVTTKITKENAGKLPVGLVWFPGHVGASIGDQKIFQSGTGVFFEKVAKGGNCPATYDVAVANPGICSYCAKLTPEDPSTGRFGANGVAGGKNGASSCKDNQGWGETSSVGHVVNFRAVISLPGTAPANPMGCCTIKNQNLMSEILCKEFAKSKQGSELDVTAVGSIKIFKEKGTQVGSWNPSITESSQCK